jgi:hypothetical protein
MSLAIKPLRTWLHILSIFPLFMTMGFVAMHFGNARQIFIFWGIFLAMTTSFPYVLKQRSSVSYCAGGDPASMTTKSNN